MAILIMGQVDLFDIFDIPGFEKPEVKENTKQEKSEGKKANKKESKSVDKTFNIFNGIRVITGYSEAFDFTVPDFGKEVITETELLAKMNLGYLTPALASVSQMEKNIVHVGFSKKALLNKDKIENPSTILLNGFELPLASDSSVDDLKQWSDTYPQYANCKFLYDETSNVIVPFLEENCTTVKLPCTLNLFGRMEEKITSEIASSIINVKKDTDDAEETEEDSLEEDTDDSEVNSLEEYPDDSEGAEEDSKTSSKATFSELNKSQLRMLVKHFLPELDEYFTLHVTDSIVSIIPLSEKCQSNGVKETTYPTSGVTLSFIFNRVPLDPSMFGGKDSVTEKELINYIHQDYPEYTAERTTIIYDKKAKLIIPQLKSARKGAFCCISEDEVKSVLIDSNYALINYTENGNDYRIEKHPIGLFVANKTTEQGCDFKFSLPKIPTYILNEVLSNFFLWGEKRKECAACIFYEHGQYCFLFPKQTVGRYYVSIDYNCIYEYLNLHPNATYVLEIHSHHILPPRFSQIDNMDEKQTLLYGVVGDMNFDDFTYQLSMRAGTGGYYYELDPEDVLDNVANARPTINWRNIKMKYYVDFLKDGRITTHCFENDKAQAEHFANCVNGTIRKDW